MADLLRVGLIGLDTSHATAFTRLLNDEQAEHHVPGAKVVAGYPGGTPGWALSESRVQGFTDQLRDNYGVQILDSPAAVAQAVDIVLITAVDGRVHRKLFEQVIAYKKPTFIDKPFAAKVEDVQAMLDMAKKAGVPLMSCSALRYAKAFTEALADDANGPIKGVDVFGPMALEDALPGLIWYGCHSVEMMVTAMGAGCREVRATVTEGVDVYTMTWDDGRVATLRGTRDGHKLFGATIHREKGFQTVDAAAGGVPYYAGLMAAVFRSVPHGRSDVPQEQMLEVVRIMEAGNEARESGEVVSLEPLTV